MRFEGERVKKFTINKIKQKIAKKLDFPRDVVLDIPRVDISVVGNEEITIENHKEILLFNENIISVSTEIGIINIEGYKLEILYIGSHTIIISGKFKTITYGDDKNEN